MGCFSQVAGHCHRGAVVAALDEVPQGTPLMGNLQLADQLAVRLFHRRECVAFVRIERYIVHRAMPPLSGLRSCPPDAPLALLSQKPRNVHADLPPRIRDPRKR